MLISDGGGSSRAVTPSTYTPPPPPPDTKTTEAVNQTLQATQFGQPTDGAQAAYQIQQTLARSDLTQDEKDAYVAEIVQLAGNGIGSTQCVDERTSEKLLHGLNDIGNAWTDPATPELRDQVEAAVSRGVADGRLDANDLYNLVREPGSAGTRQLLSEVRDGTALSSVAQRLTDDARAQGYDINKSQAGPETLVAAADIANMAAAHGNRAAANAVLAEITRVGDTPVAGDDMKLTDAMMATTLGGSQWNNLYERDGFHALSGLVNSASQTTANQPALDKLFATCVRSGGEGYVGGIDEGGDRSGALNELGKYFDRNVARLSETDWRKDNTGDFHHNLMQDFMRNVMLDPDYGRLEQTQDALSTHLSNLAAQVSDPNLTQDQRLAASTSLGAVMGSLETAGEDYIANAKGDAEAKVAFVRQFTDIVTDKLIGKLKAKLPEDAQGAAGTAAGNLVDSMWQKLVDWQTSGAINHVDESTGGLVALTETIRDSMSTGDTAYINAFDDREDLYHDG